MTRVPAVGYRWAAMAGEVSAELEVPVVRLPPRAWVSPALVGLGWLPVVLAFLLALVHLDTWWNTDFTSGVWLAHAERTAAGVFYPAPYDGELYGGTRYFPLALLYNQIFHALVPNPLVALRLASLVATAAILALVWGLLGRLGLAAPHRSLLLGWLMASHPLLDTLATVHRGSASPVALQLGALLLFLSAQARGEPADGAGRRGAVLRIAAAGVLAGLAVLTKPSAIWAGGAIGLMMLARDRRRLPILVAAGAGTLGLGLLATEIATSGRMSENLFSFSTGEMTLGAFLRAPLDIARTCLDHFPGLVLVSPLIALGFVRRGERGRVHLFQLAFLVAFFALCVLESDPGIFDSHYVDLVVLAPLAVGCALASRGRAELERGLGDGATAALVLGIGAGLLLEYREPVAATLGGWRPRDVEVVAASIPEGARVLAEDPSLEVVRGEAPLILDAYMFARIDRKHPEWVDPLLEEVRSGAFDRIVLNHDPVAGLDNAHFQRHELGPRLVRAIVERYETIDVVGTFHVLAPAPTSGAPAEPSGGVEAAP